MEAHHAPQCNHVAYFLYLCTVTMYTLMQLPIRIMFSQTTVKSPSVSKLSFGQNSSDDVTIRVGTAVRCVEPVDCAGGRY